MLNIILILVTLFFDNPSFLENQKQYPRVRNAIEDKLETIQNIFMEEDVEFPPKEIFLRIFKSEKQMVFMVGKYSSPRAEGHAISFRKSAESQRIQIGQQSPFNSETRGHTNIVQRPQETGYFYCCSKSIF